MKMTPEQRKLLIDAIGCAQCCSGGRDLREVLAPEEVERIDSTPLGHRDTTYDAELILAYIDSLLDQKEN